MTGWITPFLWIDLLIYLAAGVTAVGVIWTKVVRPIKNKIAQWDRGMKSLYGYEVEDPSTGEVVQSFKPLGQRVAAVEEAIADLAVIAKTQVTDAQRLADIEQRIDKACEEVALLSLDKEQWRKEHEAMHALAGTINHDNHRDDKTS